MNCEDNTKRMVFFFQTKVLYKKLNPTLQCMVHFIHAVREFNKNRDLHKDFLKNVCGSLYKPLPQAKQSFFSYILKEAEKTSRKFILMHILKGPFPV